jgi:hypothetical protein
MPTATRLTARFEDDRGRDRSSWKLRTMTVISPIGSWPGMLCTDIPSSGMSSMSTGDAGSTTPLKTLGSPLQ